MKDKMIIHGEIEICTESFGNPKNPAILLLAGATVSMLYWDEDFCRRLADKGFYVIRYDNRDVGTSTNYEPGSAPYNIVDFEEDAIKILDGYNFDNAHFVGISLGGLIAQIAAIRHPHRVESLTLIATGPWGVVDIDIPEMDTRILDFHAKAADVNWSQEENVVQYMLEAAKLMSGRKPFDKTRAENLIRSEYARAKNYISMFNHATLGGGEDYYNRLDEIQQPTYPMTVRPEDLRFLNESATEDAKRLFHSFLLLMIQPLAKVRLLKAEMCLC
ncbi:alpha/beta hydrolase [Sphingobacterium thalpophilum]|uniref:alpha/beta fold hydrolase n=1 Tax=Sphingobacterium thalpophilum TaxID=259 RepID=UPI0031DC6638